MPAEGRPLDFVDVTLRDGHQCLWATRMPTSMMVPVARRMDMLGFKAIDLMGALQFEVCVRYLRENPWDRIRLMRDSIRRTPLNGFVRSKSLISFNLVPDEVIELWIRRLAANGIDRLTLFDALFDLDNLARSIRIASEVGMYTVGALVYSLSPVHTDELFARKAQEFVALGVDAVLLKDPSGLLTPERVRTVVPAIQSTLAGRALEIHSHCTTGLAPIAYVEAIRLGVDAVQTAISPLANGHSLPPTERIAAFANRLNRPVNLDGAGLEEMAVYFERAAVAAGKPLGKPLEYDPRQYEHQIPGGMMANLRAQLSQIGLEHKLDEILEEAARVREELGYINMVTPTSQLVGTQAVINVVQGERYRTMPDEVIRYALGHYGKPLAPLAPDVLDRIHQTPAARLYTSREPEKSVIERVRARFGGKISDEDVLLRIMIPEEHVEAMLAAPPLAGHPPSVATPLVDLVRALVTERRFASVRLETPEVQVTARARRA
ncbi:MAG: pyruvate carboxylase subunit B [Candidatus Rokubacteria bacterium]|nr:pyruvate carboxylase subunit B [Candidatus Rokubacteria bacterium]